MTYIKHDFKNGQVLNAQDLNEIEDGIVSNDTKLATIEREVGELEDSLYGNSVKVKDVTIGKRVTNKIDYSVKKGNTIFLTLFANGTCNAYLYINSDKTEKIGLGTIIASDDGTNSKKLYLKQDIYGIELYWSSSTSTGQCTIYSSVKISSSDYKSIVCYVDVNGSDDNDGLTKLSPLATFDKAIGLYNDYNKITINVGGGSYSENINIATFSGDIDIIGSRETPTIIKQSTKLKEWQEVQNGIYSVQFSGTLYNHGNYNGKRAILYEDGRSSLPIADNERHPSQKGLSYRLPFTCIQQYITSSLEDGISYLRSNSGFFVYDGYLYLKTTDSSNPNDNGYSYELINGKYTYEDSDNIDNLYIENVSFRFTRTVSFNAKNVTRVNCSVLGCNDDGFRDNKSIVKAYYDECAMCGNDGENGHYYAITGWGNIDMRISGEMCEYHYSWCHDNGDDGLSHHEASHLKIIGGLFEYNGDGGVRLSNTCNCEIFNSCARANGQDNCDALTKKGGAGFDVVNSVSSSDKRNGSNVYLYSCLSEGNARGYSATYAGSTNRIVLINCLSGNNSIAELYSNKSKLIAKNFKYNQSDATKVKVVEDEGTILVEHFSELQ